MEDRFANRQEQALSQGFAVLMRLAWILVMAIMVAAMGMAGLVLGIIVGVLMSVTRK
jgi:MFS superfamily sulfate permease-like transporter